jgi:diguanylate cyclase (GGDEF)-like protein/PAS domain S-box-containing protein
VHVRVLIVEDSQADAELALRRLRMDGIECAPVRVETEEAFLAALREGRWDLILSDFSLPQFNGLAALEIAAREAPQVPFIFVSGTIGEERAIEALRRGAADYVLKTNLKRLAPAVRRALQDAADRIARRAAEERLQDVIETARDWIWELDRDGRFIFSSESSRDVLGLEPARILGTHFAELLHESDRKRMQKAMLELDSRSRTLGSLTARWRHADGGFRWLERHVLALVDSHGSVCGFRGADRDVTEREEQQLRIARLTRVLEMLSGINTAVVRIRDRMELLREVCRISVGTGRYVTAVVSFLQPDTRTARPTVWAGEHDADIGNRVFCVAPTQAEDSSVCGRVLRSGEPFFCNDIEKVHEAIPAWRVLWQANFRSIAALPLTVDGTTVGVLVLTASDTNSLTDEETRLLREVAANLSFALQYFEKESEVQFLSYFDPLTGLAKRALFCQRLTGLLVNGAAEEPQPAVAVLDIQHLSIINDSYGRHAGDHLLQKIADRLKDRLHSTDHIAYLGAGCFAMVLERTRSPDEALREVQQHIVAVFEPPFQIDGRDMPVTVRSGLACRDRKEGAEAEVLLQNAEAALRQAKAAGEQYHHHRLDLSSKLAARLAMEHRLRGALDNQQYSLYYQPKMHIPSGRVEGVEALLRWNDPERGLVSPAEFLPILESTGMIVVVGEWVLTQAARDCQGWKAAGLRPVRVAVNCSPLQLRRSGFAQQVLDALDGWDFDGWGLDVEITESLLIDPDSAEVHKLRTLREAGVRVAIDDFGTGYSSLSRLAALPIDTLKIDRSFIMGLPDDRSAARLVPTIIALARVFDLITVAEGVETSEQLAFLTRAGCDQSQGYLHARPLPETDMATLLAHAAQSTQVAAERGAGEMDIARVARKG